MYDHGLMLMSKKLMCLCHFKSTYIHHLLIDMKRHAFTGWLSVYLAVIKVIKC